MLQNIESICGFSLDFDEEQEKNLHASQVSCNENLRRSCRSKNVVDSYSEIKEVPVSKSLLMSRDTTSSSVVESYSEIEEVSVSESLLQSRRQTRSTSKKFCLFYAILQGSCDCAFSFCYLLTYSLVGRYSEIKEVSVPICARLAKRDRYSAIKEASALLHSSNACKESNLDEHPVFVKLLFKAHAKAGFLLSIPVKFSMRHLPEEDTMMILETSNGEEYEAKYLRRYNALSGGWRGYAIAQKLVEGDAVVFQLVEPARFKVYIIRKDSSTVNLPTTILNLYTKATQGTADKKHLLTYTRRKACQTLETDKQKNMIQFKNIAGFDDFHTTIKELLPNHDLSEETLRTYYDLCRAKNMFLHTHLSKGLNTQFFLGPIKNIISKTVTIAIAFKTSTLSSFLCDFSQLNKTLKYYQALGMNVGFMLSRVLHLRDLPVSSDGAVTRGRYMDACRECPRAEQEVKKLDDALTKLRKISVLMESEIKVMKFTTGCKYLEACSRLIRVKDEIRNIECLLAEFVKFFEHYHHTIENLKAKVNNHDLQFQEAVSAPW